LGKGDAALAALERREDDFPKAGQVNTLRSWLVLMAAIETFAVAGAQDKAAACYPLINEAIATGTVMSLGSFRLLETLAGIAAAAAQNWPAAEAHFQRALQLAATLPMAIEQPEARRFYAQMLIDRDAAGDRERAGRLLEEAIHASQRLVMPRHRELAERLRQSVKPMAPAVAAPPQPSVFRKDGPYWTVAYGGQVVRLKDSKGLRDIACLLASPGSEVHVAELASEANGIHGASPAAIGDEQLTRAGLEALGAGDEPGLDARARQAYRTRVVELRADLEEAERHNDRGRATGTGGDGRDRHGTRTRVRPLRPQAHARQRGRTRPGRTCTGQPPMAGPMGPAPSSRSVPGGR
jgi:tetratricopeptide (TPR) repeat protein